VSIFQAVKRHAIRRAIGPTAAAFDILADHLIEVPPTTLFTRDEVIELLRNVARTMRKGELP
jgi:hypothetical protein